MTSLISLRRAAQHLRVPPGWLIAEAEAGRMPALDAGGMWLCDLDAVEAALLARARGIVRIDPNDDGPGLDPRAVTAATDATRAAIAGERTTRSRGRHGRAPVEGRDDSQR